MTDTTSRHAIPKWIGGLYDWGSDAGAQGGPNQRLAALAPFFGRMSAGQILALSRVFRAACVREALRYVPNGGHVAACEAIAVALESGREPTEKEVDGVRVAAAACAAAACAAAVRAADAAQFAGGSQFAAHAAEAAAARDEAAASALRAHAAYAAYAAYAASCLSPYYFVRAAEGAAGAANYTAGDPFVARDRIIGVLLTAAERMATP